MTTRKTFTVAVQDEKRLTAVMTDKILANIARRHGASGSEASVLRVVVMRGLSALEAEADEERYAQLAAAQDDEDVAFHAGMRSRRQGDEA